MTTEKKKRQYSKIHPKHKAALRLLAEKHGQDWCAERLGITSSGVSRLLQPGNSGVRPSTLEAIVELVGKNGVAAESVPVRARRTRHGTSVGSSVSDAFAAMSKLSPEERQRVLDAINIIEGKV